MKTTKYTAWIVASGLAVLSGSVHASGFSLVEENASGLGNAFAGGAASAEDASTVFFNPAGMTRLTGTQVSIVMHAIKPAIEFSNSGSTGTGGNGGDAGSWALVPNFYVVTELSPSLRAGLGVSSPFGLKTDYDADWIGRFQAVKSDLKTININPSLAYKFNNQFSIGVGLNAQYISAELTNAVRLSGNAEGFAQVKGDDWSFGYNLGVLYELSSLTRFGLAYRSDVRHKLEGDVTFTGVPAPNGPISAEITLPETISLSGFHQINPQWAVMSDVTWTRWSRFQELRIVRNTGITVGQPTIENWDDTYRFALGASYQQSKQLKLRGGIAYDQSPVSDAYRTARIPDANRTWLSAGATYQLTKKSALDIGYAHIFIANAAINTGPPALIGEYNSSVDILSAQYNYRF